MATTSPETDTIRENTRKYAKLSVVKATERPTNQNKLVVKKIYVVDDVNTDAWRAILIDSFCQAGKTAKCFDILNEKIQKEIGTTLVLFITQANSTASANQTIQRAVHSEKITTCIPPANIRRSANAPADGALDDNYMIVDFWNSRNMSNMLEFVRNNNGVFSTIIIVVDESDQAGEKGLKDRLSFIRQVERTANNAVIKVIFITATVANLSKSILLVANANLVKFRTGVVSRIISEEVIEHHFAEPYRTYVGASWFKTTPNVWKPLIFPRKPSDMEKEAYRALKENIVMEEIARLPSSAKELGLIVTSTRTSDHSSIAQKLYRIGFNVTVEMNCTNNKNYKVKYMTLGGTIASWDIPVSQIDSKADRGDLTTYRGPNRLLVETGITKKEDYTLSHVLQAALFMMTEAEQRIRTHVTPEEFTKLDALCMAIDNLDMTHRRPADYPTMPRVALIAGHLAGRGISIQNPTLDFTCTMFCFTDTKDTIQRGATNTQRFGRACGYLLDAFTRPDKQPLLLATEGIMQDALANEEALREKADSIENGSLISLKDLVSKEDWDSILQKVKENMPPVERPTQDNTGEGRIDGAIPAAVRRYYHNQNMLVGRMLMYLYQQNGPITIGDFQAGVNYSGNDAEFESNINSGRSPRAQYGKLWCVNNGFIRINPNIKTYIDSL